MTAVRRNPYNSHTLAATVFSGLLMLALAAVVLWQAQAITDWWRLRGYEPAAAIVALADDTTMTDDARHVFYVNRPQIVSGAAFSIHCANGAEKTVILGCYESGDRGIYLYEVTDERLNGVIETTAAHEMLHAAYERLSKADKTKIDRLLTDYYAHNLTDDRVKQTIEAYRQSEPHELTNEMHSIFATEIATLPVELETYYRQYFSNRTLVVSSAQRYQAEFTSRRDKAAAYDTQLAELKKTIDSNQSRAMQLRSNIEDEYASLQAAQGASEVSAYNRMVDAYGRHVDEYNSLLGTVRDDIAQYNQIVELRNTVALEERDLVSALSDQSSGEDRN